MKKYCPLLGMSQTIQQSLLRGNPDYIVHSYVPCMGEGCIAYCDDGLCTYFRRYTENNDKESEAKK